MNKQFYKNLLVLTLLFSSLSGCRKKITPSLDEQTTTSSPKNTCEKETNVSECNTEKVALLDEQIIASSPKDSEIKQISASRPKETWITVFIHGIMSIKPHLRASNVLKFMCDDVCNTLYSQTVELMRLDRHFFKNQAMQGFGFIKIDPTLVERGYSPGAIAGMLNEITAWSEPEKIFDNHYYTYGWTGLLSPSQRFEDAKGLFLGLEKLVTEFKAQGHSPKIRVIGYSHGGNVVLNLGAVHQYVRPESNLLIDEAILLGMPVQKETASLVNDPVFKKVYHIYSGGDRVQSLDFFSFKRFFSGKKFIKRGKRILPKNLVQVELKLTRPSQHARKDPALLALSKDLSRPGITSGHSHLLRDSSPGHAELWFFAWPYTHYRETFTLHPLPTVILLPYIIKNIHMIEDITNPRKPIIVDIRPEQDVVLLRRFKGKEVIVTDFVPAYIFDQMRERAYLYKPDGYTIEEYDRHVAMAVNKAKKIYRAEWCKNPINVRQRKKQCSVTSVQCPSGKERIKEKRRILQTTVQKEQEELIK